MEISLRMQQLLLKHMEDDRKEKEHLVNELNRIENKAHLTYLIDSENKHRLWKLLRKFYSKKKLSKAEI